MSENKHRVITDPKYGYKRLEPLPPVSGLDEFYQSQYYELIKKGGRAPELRRIMAGGEEAQNEISWLEQVLYSDIEYLLKKYAPGKRMMDVGCGTGELIGFLDNKGFETMGIEPSAEAVAVAAQNGIRAQQATLEEYVASRSFENNPKHHAITLINVLEHVPNPVGIIELLEKVLEPEGLILIRVPNEFNDLQLAAQKKYDCKPWWIAIPDHINYFNVDTLSHMLDMLGFETIYRQSDFPMEAFLLMGDNYIGNPEVGSNCHQKRINFEMSISDDLRRKIYQSLAEIGVGRDIMILARKKA
jgi:2-polyprenyl-3-methyl-5-hydroxy-6-metoxy-1,4-benzoquinol methylase